MFPDFIQIDYNNYSRTREPFQKFHKFIHLNLSVLKYITIILYSSAKSSAYKTNKIDRMILERFSRPTEGNWLSLLELLLSFQLGSIEKEAKKINNKYVTSNINKFNSLFYLLMDIKDRDAESLTIYQYFQRIISIKNKMVSHGIISSERAEQFLESLDPLFNEFMAELHSIFAIPIYLVGEFNGSDLTILPVVNKVNEESVFKNASEDGLYCFINNQIVSLNPLLICKDGDIYIYNWFDKKNGKIHYSGNLDRSIYLRSYSTDVAELFNLDKEGLFIEPLLIDVKFSNTGVYHNLPTKDYSEFIGRLSEIDKLEQMLLHKRHFISALDGIGGVGKSAITMELCYRITEKEKGHPLFFEHIVWLSAKNTILRNGKIYKLEQAFEHLDQLLDSILDVLHFGEYKRLEHSRKKNIVNELLGLTSALIVLDNLETLKKGVLNEVWEFINEVPQPSKILLTSREFHYDVPQTLRIVSLSKEDAIQFIKAYSLEIGIDSKTVSIHLDSIVDLSSGLPIAIRSILGQLKLGKPFKSIQKDISNNSDDLSKFCFQQQLSLLSELHLQILMVICLSTETLDYDAILYMFPNLNVELLSYINELSSLSIIKISHEQESDFYTILPLIQRYIRSTYTNEEKLNEITQKLNDYYQLKEIDSYVLLPIEERSIEQSSLIPRKLVDKAMKHFNAGEVEQAEQVFKKVINDYENESYVWYMYAMFLGSSPSTLSEAINALKRADDLSPNYLYNKKIGDYHLQMKNFQASVKNYTIALEKSELEQNKNEMRYCIAKAEYSKVKYLRRTIKEKRDYERISERNQTYKNIITNLETYILKQPTIYDGKLIQIYRILSESYFGLKDKEKAIEFIDKAIELSDNDEVHTQFKTFIFNSNLNKVN